LSFEEPKGENVVVWISDRSDRRPASCVGDVYEVVLCVPRGRGQVAIYGPYDTQELAEAEVVSATECPQRHFYKKGLPEGFQGELHDITRATDHLKYLHEIVDNGLRLPESRKPEHYDSVQQWENDVTNFRHRWRENELTRERPDDAIWLYVHPNWCENCDEEHDPDPDICEAVNAKREAVAYQMREEALRRRLIESRNTIRAMGSRGELPDLNWREKIPEEFRKLLPDD
jgi:hypothetical protein